jgi:hypothetical protein
MTEDERKEEKAMEELPELETVCPECEGRRSWPKYGICQECKGMGVVPTEFGKRVLDLVLHHRRRIVLDDRG